jgi:endonuclease YncB( thermonuclease family)
MFVQRNRKRKEVSMHKTTAAFWTIFGLLLSASLFYGVNAGNQRKLLHHGGGRLESGNVVTLYRVIDGDTVVVSKKGDDPATVRILGIKAFESKVEKDPAARFGKASVAALAETMAGRPVRVLLNNPAKDERGRFLATLFVNDRDLGLEMVKEGLVLVYSVYPFPAMSIYLHEQELARARKKGVWGSPVVKRRAVALISEWQGQAR